MLNHEFKSKHFAPEIILWCLRWFIEYSPALRKKLRRYQLIRVDSSWQLDETYVKVKGKWFYLYRAINKQGETLDFYFSKKRNKYCAHQFLKRCFKTLCAR